MWNLLIPGLSMSRIAGIFNTDVIPAKTPMLIAIATPNFSFLFMVRVQTILHGSIAKRISIAPE